MDQPGIKQGTRRHIRWLWLAISIWGLLLTPSAIVSAVDAYKGDHQFGWIIPFAFAMRIAQIWFFAWLWWKYRPSNLTPNTSA
jgi:hypothetical protein